MQKLTEKERRTTLVHAMVVDGKWVNFYTGDPLPDLRDGAIVDLRISDFDFTNKEELEALTVVRTEMFLMAGTRVFIRLIEERIKSEDRKRLVDAKTQPWSGPPSRGAFVYIAEDVGMRLSGAKKGSLLDAKCTIPVLGGAEARSINHAYTLLSREFEVDRRSHGGNVFEAAFVEDGRDWVSLEVLRDHLMAKHEREIMAKLGVKDAEGRFKQIEEILKRR